MPLWTDIVDPIELTGYIRASLAEREAAKGSLAGFLPNREVAGIEARFKKGSSGLVEEARFRAYDAEPEVGKGEGGKSVVLELPAIGQTIPVSEYAQLIARNVDDEKMKDAILGTASRLAKSISERIERLRGTVLVSGKATIDQANFKNDDDFGRSAGHSVTAAALWTTESVDRLADLQTWYDAYVDANGVEPGALLMSNRAFRALAAGSQFKNQLLNGVSRPATEDDVRAVISAAGLPDIIKYDRRVLSGGVSTRVIPDDRILLLPAPVAADDWESTELGATYWGETLTSALPGYGLEPAEQPGIVAGVYRGDKAPAIAEVQADAISMPVLANADLSFVAKVL
jgi:hypothetical protein